MGFDFCADRLRCDHLGVGGALGLSLPAAGAGGADRQPRRGALADGYRPSGIRSVADGVLASVPHRRRRRRFVGFLGGGGFALGRFAV